MTFLSDDQPAAERGASTTKSGKSTKGAGNAGGDVTQMPGGGAPARPANKNAPPTMKTSGAKGAGGKGGGKRGSR